MNCSDKLSIEWLPIALFETHSQLVLLFRDICLDIEISGDTVRVSTQSNCSFGAVEFGSEIELEHYFRTSLRRALANDR